MRSMMGSMATQRASLGARATVCGEECGLLPPGTRFLEIFVPPFLHVHLVEQDGELRVFYIDLPLD